jgi:serine/threonine protein kinase
MSLTHRISAFCAAAGIAATLAAPAHATPPNGAGPSPLPRSLAERYSIEATGRNGGQSSGIWFGTQKKTGAAVVIKASPNPRVALREAIHIQHLNDAHVRQVPRLIERFRHGGTTYLVMENAGQPVPGGLPPRQAGAFGIQLINALDAEFKVGMHYVDLHPGNTTVRPNGTLALIDQGSAIRTTPRGTWNRGTLVGRFRAPEQLDTAGWIDERTLVYQAAGLVAYYYQGRAPYDFLEPPPAAARLIHLRSNADLSGVPPSVRPVLRRALAFNPDLRFQTLAGFRAALENAQ